MLNASLPQHLYTLVWAQYLYNLESGQGELVECVVYGLRSVGGQALEFHVLLDASFVKPFVEPPRYKTNTHAWSTEQQQTRQVTDDGRYFYGEESK